MPESKSEAVKLCIEVLVHSRDDLYDTALKRATEQDGLSLEEATELLRPQGEIDVHACLVMLFDPGTSPLGAEIICSYVED